MKSQVLLNSSFLSQKVSHFLPPDPLPVRPRLLNKHKERTNQSCLYSLRSGGKKNLTLEPEGNFLSLPLKNGLAPSASKPGWEQAVQSPPHWPAGSRERHPPPPPARSRAGGPVGRATQRTLSGLLSLCQCCLVPGICNFSHALCVPVHKWVPISSSLGFPWESNKNSQRAPHIEEGKETMKELYLLLRRNTNNPHTPHSTKADKIRSHSRALSLSYEPVVSGSRDFSLAT